jgi:transposase InsO family protein
MVERTDQDRLTSGLNTWRAGCGGSRTSGSEGGPRKPTSRKAGRAPRSDPYTYVPTWSGMVYVAFVLDAYSRRILGWRAATSMKTSLVLDALEQAVWTRTRDGVADLSGLIHHHDAGSQYTSIAFTERLAEAGIDPSVGTVGDAYDTQSMLVGVDAGPTV